MYKNTDALRERAIEFMENGHYTAALSGTQAYYDFWDEEKNRSLYGYTVGDLTITGNHYFYLNYCPIDRSVKEILPDGTEIARRDRSFPAFYDGDCKYFNALDVCRKTNKHLTVLKARRKGYSYKAAAMLARNYFHVRNSKNYVFHFTSSSSKHI